MQPDFFTHANSLYKVSAARACARVCGRRRRVYLGEGSHLVRVTLGRQLAVAVSFAMLYAQLAASCSGWERRKQGAAWAAVIDTCLDPPPAGGERGRPHAPLLLATPRRPLLRRIGRDGALHRMMRAALLHSSPVLLAEVAAAALGLPLALRRCAARAATMAKKSMSGPEAMRLGLSLSWASKCVSARPAAPGANVRARAPPL